MIIAVVATAVFLLAGMLFFLSFRRCGKRFYLYFGVWYLLMAPFYVAESIGRHNRIVLSYLQLKEDLARLKGRLDNLPAAKMKKLRPQLAELKIELSTHENELNAIGESPDIRHASAFWPKTPWSAIAVGSGILSFVLPTILYLRDTKRSRFDTESTPLTADERQSPASPDQPEG